MKTLKQFLEEAYSPVYNTQYGSNEGGIHIDSETQKKHYIKFPDEEQGRVEAATAELYEKWGIETVKPKMVDVGNRKGVSSEWNEDLKQVRKNDIRDMGQKSQSHAFDLAKMHHAAVITNNRDIVGSVPFNIVHDVKRDKLVSIDQGGSMHYRAMGGKKPFQSNIDELESFKNPQYTTSHIFSPVQEHHPEAFKRALEPFKSVPDGDIRATMNKHGLNHLSDVVIARKNMLISALG
jgi:hypothetical protein